MFAHMTYPITHKHIIYMQIAHILLLQTHTHCAHDFIAYTYCTYTWYRITHIK